MTLGNRSPVMSNKALVPPFSLIYDLRYVSVDARTFLVGRNWDGRVSYRHRAKISYRESKGRPNDKRCFICLHVYNVYRTLVHKSLYRFDLTLDLLMDRNVGAFSRNYAIDRLRRIEIWMDRWARESFSAWPVPPNQQQ